MSQAIDTPDHIEPDNQPAPSAGLFDADLDVEPPVPLELYDTVVVGSGPAGLSAAVYSSRAGLSTLIVTGESVGGTLNSTEEIDNYLGMPGSGGMNMAKQFVDHAQKFGATLLKDVVTSITLEADDKYTLMTRDGKTVNALSVVYATGGTPRKLGVPGESHEGVSYCATCDGLFFEGDDVVVVGGGETAAEDALYMAGLANSVTVLVRSQWRATPTAVAKLEEQPNVRIITGAKVDEILEGSGELAGLVSSIKMSGVDGGNVEVPETADVAAVFVAIGNDPNSVHARDFTQVSEDGVIEFSHHKHKGFFVAGDVATADMRQVAVAVGDGAKAGIEATRYVLSVR